METNIGAANDKSEIIKITGDGEGGGGEVEEMALKKGPWTAAEDAVLMEYVTKHGEGNWNAVQRNTGLARCGKSCRLRWTNHLRPNLKKGAFSPEEEKLILELHAQYGNKWARMATLLPGRTDNEIKNYWNTRIKRRQRQGLPLYSDSPDQSNNTGTPATLSTHSATSLPTAAATTNFEFYHQNHFPLSSLPPGPTYGSKPFFDPNSFSSSSSLPFAFHQPTPLHCTNPFRPKRYRSSTTTLMDQPVTTTTTTTTTSATTQLADLDGFIFPVQLNSSSCHIYQTPLDSSSVSGVSNPSPMFPTKLELPSNQFSQSIDSDINLIMEMNNPALESNSDLLGDLLLQAEAMASCQNSKKRNYLSFSEGNDLFNGIQGFDDLPLSSVYCSSTPGLKAKEEAPDLRTKSMNDLSTLLDAVPSSIQFPDWQNDSAAAEICSVQSCSSLIIPDDNFGLDMMKPLTSLFPVTNTTNPNEKPACYTWDTLPGLC